MVFLYRFRFIVSISIYKKKSVRNCRLLFNMVDPMDPYHNNSTKHFSEAHKNYMSDWILILKIITIEHFLDIFLSIMMIQKESTLKIII